MILTFGAQQEHTKILSEYSLVPIQTLQSGPTFSLKILEHRIHFIFQCDSHRRLYTVIEILSIPPWQEGRLRILTSVPK